MERQCYSFGRFRIDTDSRVLFHDEQRLGIPPKSAEVLLALLAGAGELVGKEALIKLVWPDTIVEDTNLAKHIFLLRKTLGESKHGVPFIETVPKRGYRFVGQIQPEQRVTAVLEYEGYYAKPT